MDTPANHQQLVAAAKRRADEYVIDLEKQKHDVPMFAKIGEYTPSNAEKEQLQRLAAIQKEANETVFDSRVRFKSLTDILTRA